MTNAKKNENGKQTKGLTDGNEQQRKRDMKNLLQGERKMEETLRGYTSAQGQNKAANTEENYSVIVRVSQKGQVVIPVKMRRSMGVHNGGGHVKISLVNGKVIVEKEPLLTADQLYGLFNKPEDKQNFVLDLPAAREERVESVMKKSGK
jgi:SpoVT / AbrB like domain.